MGDKGEPTAVIRAADERTGEPAEPLIQPKPLSSTPPKDRFLGVFFILFLQGCAVLAPWNMFITFCFPYFINYKLSNEYANKTGEFSGDRAEELTTWQNNFCHRMTIANQIPNMIFTLVNCFIQFGEHTLGIRIIISLLISVVSFVVTVLLAVIDTSGSASSVFTFIWVSLGVVVIMMAAVGVYQNSVWGLVAPLPMQYANAIILGNNFIGILITLFSIATQISSPDTKIAAIYYFMMGIFLLLAAFDTYFALPLLKFYRYYVSLKERNTQQGPKPTFVESMKTFASVFRKLWIHFYDVFATFFVTLFAFPNIVMWIAATEDENFFIDNTLYAQILCFLTFNVFAFLGNLIPNWLQKPGPKFLWIFTTARFLFIPFFLLFNFTPPAIQGEASIFVRRFPVLIGSSWIYWITMILFSLSHGHASSLAMMYAPKQADPANAGKAAMLAGVFLVFGVNGGIILSGFVEKIMITTK